MSSVWGECGRTSRIRRSSKILAAKKKQISWSRLQSLISSQVGKLVSLGSSGGHPDCTCQAPRRHFIMSLNETRIWRVFMRPSSKSDSLGVRLIVSPRGELIGAARSCGIQVWGELFSDRAYTPQVAWCRAVSRVRFSATGGDQEANGNIPSERRGLLHRRNTTGARCPDGLCSCRFSECFAHRPFAGITLPCWPTDLAVRAR